MLRDCGWYGNENSTQVGRISHMKDECARAVNLYSVVVGALQSDTGPDPPIYLLVQARDSPLWYKIGRKPGPLPLVYAQVQPTILHRDVERSWAASDCEDEIEQLDLPLFPGHEDVCGSLAVVEETLYLVGGRSSGDISQKGTVGYQFIQLNPPAAEQRLWQYNTGYDGYEQFGSVVYGEYIYTAGEGLYRFKLTGECEKLPSVPGYPGTIHLLGVGRSGLYAYTTTLVADDDYPHRSLGPNVLHYLDLTSMVWTVGCDNFWGEWSTGVMMFDDKYLFAFGIDTPYQRIPTTGPKPGIYYILCETRKWSMLPLDLPSECLPNRQDHWIIERQADAKWECTPKFTPFLVQLSESKLALLWDFFNGNADALELNWTKFRLHTIFHPVNPPINPDDGPWFFDNRPEFGAVTLSKGFSSLDASATLLRNCAAAVSRGSGWLVGPNGENSRAEDATSLRVKLVLLGASGVGKSCIVFRYTSKTTLEVPVLSQTIALEDSRTVNFQIWDLSWDLPGPERHDAPLLPVDFGKFGVEVAVIVYDITSADSFKKAQYWVKELQKHDRHETDFVLALVGNKADLHEKRVVSVQAGMRHAEENGMFFIETSAKTAANINQLFEELAKRLPRPALSSS